MERKTGNSASRHGAEHQTRCGLACLYADATLDGLALFDIVPTVTDLFREVVLPLRASWHNEDITNFVGCPRGFRLTAIPVRPDRRHLPPRRSPTAALIPPTVAGQNLADITLPAAGGRAAGSGSGGADRGDGPSPTRPERSSPNPTRGEEQLVACKLSCSVPNPQISPHSFYLTGCTGFAISEMHLCRNAVQFSLQVMISLGFKTLRKKSNLRVSRALPRPGVGDRGAPGGAKSRPKSAEMGPFRGDFTRIRAGSTGSATDIALPTVGRRTGTGRLTGRAAGPGRGRGVRSRLADEGPHGRNRCRSKSVSVEIGVDSIFPPSRRMTRPCPGPARRSSVRPGASARGTPRSVPADPTRSARPGGPPADRPGIAPDRHRAEAGSVPPGSRPLSDVGIGLHRLGGRDRRRPRRDERIRPGGALVLRPVRAVLE